MKSETYRVGDIQVTQVSAVEGGPPARPPLLLVHGASHGAWCWEYWLERLPPLGWSAHALSLRNHPPSGTVPEETFLTGLRVADYADDVAAVADRIGRPCAVIGHSMGGIVAQSFAARSSAAGRPPAALVLLASASPGALGPLRAEPLPTDRPFELAPEEAAARYFSSAAPAAMVERALARLVGESPAVMNDYSLAPGVAIAPADIACPLLVVTAGRDGTLVPRDSSLADYYGGDHLHASTMGHNLMLEPGWEALLDDILSWLDDRLGRG